MFVGLHAMLAMQTKTPELAISEQEGRDFTKAAQNVMRHYSVQTTQKTLDWIAFAGVATGMYGTRAFAISVRRAAERKDSGERGQVLRFPDRGRRAATEAAPADPGAAPAYEPSVPHPQDFGPGDEGSGF